MNTTGPQHANIRQRGNIKPRRCSTNATESLNAFATTSADRMPAADPESCVRRLRVTACCESRYQYHCRCRSTSNMPLAVSSAEYVVVSPSSETRP